MIIALSRFSPQFAYKNQCLFFILTSFSVLWSVFCHPVSVLVFVPLFVPAVDVGTCRGGCSAVVFDACICRVIGKTGTEPTAKLQAPQELKLCVLCTYFLWLKIKLYFKFNICQKWIQIIWGNITRIY